MDLIINLFSALALVLGIVFVLAIIALGLGFIVVVASIILAGLTGVSVH